MGYIKEKPTNTTIILDKNKFLNKENFKMVNLSQLNVYVDENKLDLIRKSVLGAKTIGYLNIQSDVVGKTKINLLETEVVFGDGAVCGWNEAGTSTITQREINPAPIKVNMSFCDKSMQKYFMNHQITVAAGRSTLPFEEHFIAGVVEGVGKKLEDAIWNGVTVGGTLYEGLTQIVTNQASAGSTVYDSVRNLYNGIPAASLTDTVIFIGIDGFRSLAGELTAKNLYHYDPKIDEAFEMVLPGTTTKVIGVPGLDGSNKAYAINTKHAFYGTDMQNDNETFDFWYSKDNQEFRLAINFVEGVQVAFPEENSYVMLTA